MQDDQDARETTDTLSAPAPSSEELKTNPEASLRPAIAPPAKLPSEAELESSAVALTEPPEWFKSSFLGKVLSKFADDAEDIRKGRNAQHAEVMEALRLQDSRQDAALDRVSNEMARLVLEVSANLELLSGEFKSFRTASEARLSEGDKRFDHIEKKVADLEAKAAELLERRLTEALKPIAEEFEEIRKLIADLRADVTARPPASTPA